jgi:hypothetical protein
MPREKCGRQSLSVHVPGDGTGKSCCQPPPHMTSRKKSCSQLPRLVFMCAGGRDWQLLLAAFPSHDKPSNVCLSVLGDGTGKYFCQPPPHMISREESGRQLPMCWGTGLATAVVSLPLT